MGHVSAAEFPKEQATHSMEHGVVKATDNPSLPKGQMDELAKKVNGKPFMLMSPYQRLDKPISLQAWGYQLKVDNASDSRIDDFIGAQAQRKIEAFCAASDDRHVDTGLNGVEHVKQADRAGHHPASLAHVVKRGDGEHKK